MPRVRISYGIEIENVPKEVQRLFDNVGDNIDTLSKQADTVDDLLDNEESEACISVMRKMRQTLATMDARIEDLSSIVEGYDAYIKQNGAENEPSERRSTVDTTSSNVVSRSEQRSDGRDVESGTESSDIS